MNVHSPIPHELQQIDHQSFLGRAYLLLLGRPIDPVGLRDYLQRLNAGTPRDQVWDELSNSEEGRRFAQRQSNPVRIASSIADVTQLLALDGSAFLAAAYLKVLGRPIDPTGLRDYSARLVAGDGKEQVLCDICSDPEGVAYNAQLRGLAELKLQHQLVKSASHTAQELLSAGDAAFVSAAARIIFGRQAATHELDMYMGFLSEGTARAFVLKRMLEAKPESKLPKPLAAYVRQYDSANRKTWGGWYMRSVQGIESDFPMERTLRAIAFRAKLERERRP